MICIYDLGRCIVVVLTSKSLFRFIIPEIAVRASVSSSSVLRPLCNFVSTLWLDSSWGRVCVPSVIRLGAETSEEPDTVGNGQPLPHSDNTGPGIDPQSSLLPP